MQKRAFSNETKKPEYAEYAHIITEKPKRPAKKPQESPEKKVVSGEQTDNKFIYLQYCFSKPY